MISLETEHELYPLSRLVQLGIVHMNCLGTTSNLIQWADCESNSNSDFLLLGSLSKHQSHCKDLHSSKGLFLKQTSYLPISSQ